MFDIMNVIVGYRNPDEDHITLVYESKEVTITLDQYIDIIRPCSKIEGSGKEYLECRNKILREYIINGPKEQFSW